MTEEDLRKYKELTDLFAFLDEMIPLDDEEELEPGNAGDKRQGFFAWYFLSAS